MRKVYSLILMAIFFLAPFATVFAQDETPPQPMPIQVEKPLLKPLEGSALPSKVGPMVPLGFSTLATTTYTLSGRIIEAEEQFDAEKGEFVEVPVAGVTLTTPSGASVVTDDNGFYSITVPAGSSIWPRKEGYDFEPAYMQAKANNTAANFSAVSSSNALAAPTGQVIPNPSFEIVPYYWNPISGNSAGFTPYYTTAKKRTGSWSGFTGMTSTQRNSFESWSRWRTQAITIPDDATKAELVLYMWPKSSDTLFTLTNTPSRLAPPAPLGIDTETPGLMALGYDMQYVAVLDANTNIVLEYLYRRCRNDQVWRKLGPFNLLAYSGQTIKIEFGTVNDTDTKKTLAYFDDVTLNIETSGVSCYNLLLNSKMSTNTGWATYSTTLPPFYTTSYYYSYPRSLKTGLAAGQAYPATGNEWTTEAYQLFTIPADATFARLTMRLLPRSTNTVTKAEPQYGYIGDDVGVEGEKLLFKWWSLNSSTWLYRAFNVLSFRGTDQSVIVGTVNRRYSANYKTVLYTDDVYLTVCVPTP